MRDRSQTYFLTSTFAVSICFVAVFVLFSINSRAQIVRAGVKGGVSVNWVKFESASFRDTVKSLPGLGFDAGAALAFKVKDRYFLHTEYVYSQKTKILEGKLDPDLKDEMTYHYFEVPILFTMHFNGKIGKNREFKYYLGVGPNISYFMGGNGTVDSGEHKENAVPPTRYDIEFGERPFDLSQPDIVYYPKPNEWVFGLNFGSGLILEPGGSHKVLIDLRYEVDQTRIGKSLADYEIPVLYDDNLKARMRAFRVSLIYMNEFNLGKKERNKGKSTIKRKRR